MDLGTKRRGPVAIKDVSEARNKLLRLVKRPSAADAHAHLMSTIDEEILPKLLLVSLTSQDAGAVSTRVPPTETEVAELARIAAARDLEGAFAFIEAALSEGLASQTVLLNLVRPAARVLRDDWESNGVSFDDAMAGLDTLEHVVRVLIEVMSGAQSPP